MCAAFLVILSSCTTDCYQPKRSLLGVAFLDSQTVKPYTVKRLTVKGVGTDSILYNSVSASTVYLPLHIKSELTEYEFTVEPEREEEVSINFTLSISHDVRPQFVSPECDCVPTYRIKNVTHTPNKLIRKFEIYNDFVTNEEKAIHIKIYTLD